MPLININATISAPPSASASITRTMFTGVAPDSAMYTITGETGLALPLEKCSVTWDFDDAGSVHDLLPNFTGWTDLRNANKALGHVALKTHRNAGTYGVSATIYDGTQTITATLDDFTVADRDTFNWFEVVVVDPTWVSGTIADAPLTPDRIETSLEDAFIQTFTDNQEPRIIFVRRGHSYMAAGAEAFLRFARKFHVVPFGTGDKPIINGTFYTPANDGWEWHKFEGLQINGGYDTNLESGTPLGHIRSLGTDGAKGEDVVHILDCYSSGSGIAFTHDGSSSIVSDTEVTNWQNQPFFDFYRGGLVGCYVHQAVDARGGGLSKNVNKIEHGPIRIQGTDGQIYCVNKNRFFNNSGWSLQGAVPFHQPIFRMNTDSATNVTAVFTQNYSEGGGDLISTIDKNGAQVQPGFRFLIAYNYMTGSPSTGGALIQLDKSGVYIRSNIFYLPDVPFEGPASNEFRAVLSADGNSTPPVSVTVDPIEIVSNTFIIERSGIGSFALNSGGSIIVSLTDAGFTLVDTGNIYHAPNATSALDAGPFTNVDLQSLQYRGQYFGNTPVLDLTYRQDDVTAKLWTPDSGSTHYQNRVANSSVDNFFGETPIHNGAI